MFLRLGQRAVLTLINVFFPPLSVMLLTGLGQDSLINSILFLCGVLPSHVHGFYISCTYFHRRGKFVKGKYPGDPKAFIYSDKVINGGGTNAQVEALWRKERGLERGKSGASGKSRRGSRRQSNYVSQSQPQPQVQRQESQMRPSRVQSQRRTSRPIIMTDGYEGYDSEEEMTYVGGGGYSPTTSSISGPGRTDSRVGGGVGRVDSAMSRNRHTSGVDRVNSRARRSGYGSIQSSPISPISSQSRHWR